MDLPEMDTATAALVIAQLDTARADTTRLRLLTMACALLFELRSSQPYQEQLKVLAEKLASDPDPSVQGFFQRVGDDAFNFIALYHQNRGEYALAVRSFIRALDLARLDGDTGTEILMHNNLGLLYGLIGDRDAAAAQFRACLQRADGQEAGAMKVMLLERLVVNFSRKGDLDSAAKYMDRLHALSHAISPGVAAVYHASRKEFDLAAPAFRNAIDHKYPTQGRYYCDLSRALVGSGRTPEAVASLDECVDWLRKRDSPRYLAMCLLERAVLHKAMGNAGRAEQDLLAIQALATDVGYMKEEYEAAVLLRDLYREQGRLREALAMSDRAGVLADSINAFDARTFLQLAEFKHAQKQDSLAAAADRDRLRSEAELQLSVERGRRNTSTALGASAVLLAFILYRRYRHTARMKRMIEHEKDRSDSLLLNILPAEVAEELKNTGAAQARHFERATVLFTDFKGFTDISEKLAPNDLVRDLNECFSAFDRICERHRIEKIKTIGDAYMAAGGLPVPNATHATDVINAALEMRDFIAEGKARKVAAGLPCFEIRIGIHTGPVVAGVVGEKKFAYDIWGDTVNTASRMESSGEVGQVNISEATYALVTGDVSSQFSVVSGSDGSRTTDDQQPTTPAFIFTPRGKVQVKGKGEMEMYFVHRSTEGASVDFVGRDLGAG